MSIHFHFCSLNSHSFIKSILLFDYNIMLYVPILLFIKIHFWQRLYKLALRHIRTNFFMLLFWVSGIFIIFLLSRYFQSFNNAHTQNDANIFHLNESFWKFYSPENNISGNAIVPGDIYSDLERNRLIPRTLFGLGDVENKWVGRSKWTYMGEFDLPAQVFKVLCQSMVGRRLI